MIEQESPWSEERAVSICSGADLLIARDAAEKAVRRMIEAAPPAANWIRTTSDDELDEGVRDSVDRLCHEWEDEELPLADLTMDVEARPRRRVSAREAAQDVERLFSLLSHGYAGYGFLLAGIVCLVWGGSGLRSARRRRKVRMEGE